MADVIVRVENLGKTYLSGSNPLVVFANVNFELRIGESVALVGESGTGKSTLLHLLGALDTASGGEIYFDGQPLSTRSHVEISTFRNRQIGFVWQSHNLLPEFTALENVMMPLLIGGLSRAEAAEAARLWLDRVGLGERTSHQAGELSGGEQQRVSTARALVRSPRLLIADEPTGNLDQRTGGSIIDLLIGLPRNHQLAAIIATHNMGLAARCDRLFRIEAGRLFEDALPNQGDPHPPQ
jgi:lipoprotein-releasing system ATP-binding protein